MIPVVEKLVPGTVGLCVKLEPRENRRPLFSVVTPVAVEPKVILLKEPAAANIPFGDERSDVFKLADPAHIIILLAEPVPVVIMSDPEQW